MQNLNMNLYDIKKEIVRDYTSNIATKQHEVWGIRQKRREETEQQKYKQKGIGRAIFFWY